MGDRDAVFSVLVFRDGRFRFQTHRDLNIGRQADTTAIDGSTLVQIPGSTNVPGNVSEEQSSDYPR